MKRFLFAAAVLLLCSGMATVSAKKQPVPRMYMFGLAASFTDTIVHITPIQELDSVWIDTKNNFLQERQEYSYQMRNYLNEQQMAHRTCVVFYSQKKKSLEKKYEKIMRLYAKPGKDGQLHFDVRHLSESQFRFHTIDLSAYANDPEPQAEDGGQQQQ